MNETVFNLIACGIWMILTFLYYTAANGIPTSPLPRIRDEATNTCINILQSYRKHCASVTSSGQLILPEALKLLPLYTLGMIPPVSVLLVPSLSVYSTNIFTLFFSTGQKCRLENRWAIG